MAVFSYSTCATQSDPVLVLHYAFDGAKDSYVQDRSGYRNDGRIVGDASRVSGEFGTALELNGADAYVDCGVSPSLDIGKSGTIMLWLKPQAPRQGGLVGFSAGEKNTDQRLVVSLNTWTEDGFSGEQSFEALGTYVADGEHFTQQFRTPEHKPYFPPADEWLFFAVTFDGRTVNYYRNGVAVETRFQSLVPDVENVPLWLGRCVGLGGPSDYFRGLIDEVRIFNSPLSHKDVYRHYMESATGRSQDTSAFGSIAIKTVVNSEAGTVFADLDYRGLALTTDTPVLSATLFDSSSKAVAWAKIRMVPTWGHAEALIDVSNLPAGRYTLRVEPDKGTAASVVVEWPGRAKGWETVRVLNNFCWELLNEFPGNQKSEYIFTNPRRGWVYFATEGEGDLTLNVPGATPEVVYSPGKSGKQEVMRWMEPGEHRIALSGTGAINRLVVRSVPILLYWHYPHIGPGVGNDSNYLDKHVLGSYNMIHTHTYGPDYNPGAFRQKWAIERGLFAIEGVYPKEAIFQKKLEDGTAQQKITEFLTEKPGMQSPEYRGVIIDEFSPGNDVQMFYKSHYDEWTQACIDILNDSQYAGRFIMPAMGYNMYDFEKSAAFLTGLIENGSYVIEEHYLNERDTEDEAWRLINEYGAGLERKRQQGSSGYTENVIKLLSYLQREIWNPASNFRVFLDMQFEHHATRPEFFGVGGMGAYSSYNCNNEEYVRWVSELCRHYAIEGNTDRLSSDPYEVNQIRNPDFLEGTEGWILDPAEDGSMAVKSHKGYGVTQERRPHMNHTDMPFLWTKRSDLKPNRISQEIRNLEAGKLYLVRLWIGDYNELLAKESKDEPRAFSFRVDGASVWDDWYRTQFYEGNEFTFASHLPPFDYDNRYYFRIHQLIFRATGPTAELVISDWTSDAEPGGPVGQELIFNMIDVHPYLEPKKVER